MSVSVNMTEPVQATVSPAVNGGAEVEVSVNALENNSSVLLKDKGKDENGCKETELDANSSVSLPTNHNSFHETQTTTTFDQSNDTCDSLNQTEAASDPCHVSLNANGINEKCGGNTYVVSTDSDDDRNARCIPMYRGEVVDVSDNSDTSDSETSSTVSDDNEDSDNASVSSDKSDSENKKTSKVTRTKGELALQDLPPIEDLKISIEENKCKPVGSVLNIVDEMVVIQSFPNTPPLDIDTVLFLDRGQRALGKIFDVFGPVHEPFYSIRFNSHEHIKEKDVKREQVVYCAPQTEYTSYIPVSELLRERGSDASWTHNNEPPVTCLDFSDDEQEARHKRPKVKTGSKREISSDNDLFVKQMNQKNLELTAKRWKEDEAKQKRGSGLRKVGNQPGESLMNVAAHSFTPFAKSRTFTNSTCSNGSDQPCSTSFFHHPAGSAVVVNTHSSMPSPSSSNAPRAMNYLRNAAAAAAAAAAVASYSPPPPLNYAFPTPQHFMCSSPHQLPNQPQPPSAAAAAAAAAARATQNYLAMYHHHQRPPPTVPPTTAPPMIPSPFSHFTAASIPPMPTFVTQPQPQHHQQPPLSSQPSMLPSLPPTFNASVPPPPPPFASFNPLPTPPLPSSLPQPNFFAACTDAAGGASVRHQAATYMPLNMRPGVPPTFHPQFVLPPPPPPPPPGTTPLHAPQQQPSQLPQQQQQQHQRDVLSIGSRVPDRRTQPQSSHQTTSTFYPSSPSIS